MPDRMKTQRAEFDALDALIQANRALDVTAVVDDDYPEVRHVWEGALATFVAAMKANGRFEPGNRYGLTEGVVSDFAIAIAEEAFKAGFEVAAGNEFHTANAEAAWGKYEPSEAIKELTR